MWTTKVVGKNVRRDYEVWPNAEDGWRAADGTSGVVLGTFGHCKAMHHRDPDHRLRFQLHPLQETSHVNLWTTARLMTTHTHTHTHTHGSASVTQRNKKHMLYIMSDISCQIAVITRIVLDRGVMNLCWSSSSTRKTSWNNCYSQTCLSF